MDATSRFCSYCGKEQLTCGTPYYDRGAIEILKERYARGEISTEEFQKMKREVA
ncbi:SHOCT domain-containing protein [Candidatus Bathyarchaeota archaeon]|nr:SHOCT domain-containing protein [Candidatus Bathyarchaeota archaeon]